jgi:hypothetical protein
MIIPVNLRSKPGIKRDGTRFEGDYYVDGQWVRFQRGLPRKIGGYRQISNYINGVTRQFYTQAQNNLVYTHVGHSNGVQGFTIDQFGNTSAPTDRTPLGFVSDSQYQWNFDAMFDAAGGSTIILANGTLTLDDISNTTNKPVYYGDIYGTAPLQPLVDTTSGNPLTTCGNIVVLHPYLFLLCKNGYVRWSDVNDPSNFSTGDAGDAYISSSKLIKGLPLRGGGQSPAGLFWTLDSLIRCTYTGGIDVFRFDTVTASTSVLATNSIIEYDGIYFWVGLDRFMMYNGVVREVENNMNINDFFDNLNFQAANKIFAYKVPRFGEIWWCYPRGQATECTHAVIYNVRENTWYDCELPNGGRSAGIYAQVYQSPLLAGIQAIEAPAGDLRITEAGDSRITQDGDFRITDTGYTAYKIWQHEYGVDEIDGSSINAVRSFFETGDISLLTNDEPKNRSIRIEMIEPDFVQSGDMSVQVTGRINARAPEVLSPPKIFPAVATEPYEQQVFFKDQRRELRFRFESNTVGGDYQMGQVVVHIEVGDGRYQS